MKVPKNSRDAASRECTRIKDKCGHFLGEIKNGTIYIYCRRCKDFHVLENIQIIDNKGNDKAQENNKELGSKKGL
jgi:hypothetical protein